MHGLGRYLYSDDRCYEGQYQDDKKHGYGIYTCPDGRVYKGYWKAGKQSGLAEFHVKTQT